MASNKYLANIGLTRGKAILIAVLAIIFVGVMVSNFSSSEPETNSKTTSKATNSRRPALKRVAKPGPDGKRMAKKKVGNREIRNWPKFKLFDVVKHDPFALPEELRPPVVEPKTQPDWESESKQAEQDRLEIARQERLRKRKQQFEKLKELQEAGIGIALVSPESKIIKVGDEKLQVGDLLEGFRIVEIRPDGSVVVTLE